MHKLFIAAALILAPSFAFADAPTPKKADPAPKADVKEKTATPKAGDKTADKTATPKATDKAADKKPETTTKTAPKADTKPADTKAPAKK